MRAVAGKGADTEGLYAGVPYDGNDANYRDFYFDNYQHVPKDPHDTALHSWYTANTRHHRYWLDVMKELIDLYQPDRLYSDGALPFGQGNPHAPGPDSSPPGEALFAAGLEAVAYLYNKSASKHDDNRAGTRRRTGGRNTGASGGSLPNTSSQLVACPPRNRGEAANDQACSAG